MAAVWASFCLLILLAALSPHRAYGSAWDSLFGRKQDAAAAPTVGICASSVVVHGYPCQEFEVTTQDGYILSLQRIPEGRGKGSSGGDGGIKKPPVLIQHGVLVVLIKGRGSSLDSLCGDFKDLHILVVHRTSCDPDGILFPYQEAQRIIIRREAVQKIMHRLTHNSKVTWLLNSPDRNLPLILADNGFDVWIANTRGTRFSRRHTSMDPSDPKFWNWSWDELVAFDLPAVFDFVYDKAGQKINYVGHSQGTLIVLASLSEGKLVDQMKSAALLSPIAYLSHMNTALGVAAAKSFVGEITTLFGLAEFNPKGDPAAQFLKVLCAYPGVDCYDLVQAITGKNCCLNSSTVDLFLENEPQSTSTKNMVHLAQTVRDGKLAKYNYGIPLYNLMHYGESNPPVYDLSNIPHDLPLFLSYGGLDALSDPRDVARLLDSLKLHDVGKLTEQYIENYAHADFIMGLNAKDIVYNQVTAFFNQQR